MIKKIYVECLACILLGAVPCYLTVVNGHFGGLISYLNSLNLPWYLVLYPIVLYVIYFEIHRQQATASGYARVSRLKERYVTLKAIVLVGEGVLGVNRCIAGSLFVVGMASILVDSGTLSFVVKEAESNNVSKYVFGPSSVVYSLLSIILLTAYQSTIDRYVSLARAFEDNEMGH